MDDLKCQNCGKKLKEINHNDLICTNKWCGEEHARCSICKKVFTTMNIYDYRNFYFCEAHFDEGKEGVNYRRQEAIEASMIAPRSVADGEWHRGGYKYMKVDEKGEPIPSEVKEPQVVADYEAGKW